jgi:hypothetical protein
VEKEQLLQELALAQSAAQASNKELKDVQKDLSSTKMEVTMLMSQQRNKLATQQQHKKILKKEVIDLRQKVEDVVSEHSSLQHECDKVKLQLEQERSKSDLLSRYIDKMESQVQVQQNMMEMMSQAGGSVYGGGMSVVHVGSGGGGGVAGTGAGGGRSIASRMSSNEFTPNRRNNHGSMNHIPTNMTHRSSADADDDDGDQFDHDGAMEDFENDEKLLMQQPNIPSTSPRNTRHQRRPSNSTPQRQLNQFAPRRGNSYHSDHDVDNKSHVSELTEDRTQREFALFQNSQHHFASGHAYEVDAPPSTSPTVRAQDARFRKRIQEQRLATSPRFMTGPPSVIIGVKKNDSNAQRNSESGNVAPSEHIHELETIHYSSGSVRSMPVTDRHSNSNAAPSSNSVAGTGMTVHVTSRRDIPRSNHIPSGSVRDASSDSSADETRNNGTTSTMNVEAVTPTKLTVAQRARQDADSKTTPIHARLDETSLSALKRSSSATNMTALANLGVTPRVFSPQNAAPESDRKPLHDRDKDEPQPSRTPTNTGNKLSSPQHSQGSGLWRRMEEAVLGPRSDDDEESYTNSEGSTRVTDLTDGDRDAQAAARVQSAKERFSGRDVREIEEKKSCDSHSVSVRIFLKC